MSLPQHIKAVISLQTAFTAVRHQTCLKTKQVKRNAIIHFCTDVTIMLLGLNGAGKSASGNTILGEDRHTFMEDFSPEAVTKFWLSAHTELNGQTLTVIDTVGLPDTDAKTTDYRTKIEQTLKTTQSGVDVFLLVIKLGDKFTGAEINVMKWIKENLGAKVSKRTLVLLTHGDELSAPVETYLSKSRTLQSIVDQCWGRYHVFNNKDKDRAQVTELLDKINKMRMMNGLGTRYGLQDYKEAQKDVLLKDCAITAAVGGVVSSMVSSALGAGKAAAIGAGIGNILLAAAVWAGLWILARKYLWRT